MSDTITDGVIADAAAEEAKAASQKSRSRFYVEREGHCSNCGTKLRGRICHSCGQDSESFQRPIWSLLWEVFEGLGGPDGRLWRTVPALMFRPGYLTKQYLQGVRARYVQPFRLYLMASILFFLLTGLTSLNFDTGSQAVDEPATDEVRRTPTEEELSESAMELSEAAGEASIPAVRDQLEAMSQEFERSANEATDGNFDEAALAEALSSTFDRDEMVTEMRRSLLPEDYPDNQAPVSDTIVLTESSTVSTSFDAGALRYLPLQMRRQLADQFETVIRDPSRLFAAMAEQLPRLLFLLLPVYALIVAIGQVWRGGFYFYDHLIVSLHFHSFLFLMLILLNVASPLIGAWGFLIFLIWSNYYLYRLHRYIYEHGRFMSAVRTLTLDLTYLIVIALASPILLLVGVMAA